MRIIHGVSSETSLTGDSLEVSDDTPMYNPHKSLYSSLWKKIVHPLFQVLLSEALIKIYCDFFGFGKKEGEQRILNSPLHDEIE